MKTIFCYILSKDIVQTRCKPTNNKKCRDCRNSNIKLTNKKKKQKNARKNRSVPSLNIGSIPKMPNFDYQGEAVLGNMNHSNGFSQKDIPPILESIGLSEKYNWTDKTTEKLDWITKEYFADIIFYQNEPSPPEVRESLKILHTRALAFSKALEQIDFSTQYNYLKKNSVYIDLLEKITLRFASDAKKAYETTPIRKSGKNEPLREYIFRLANLFFEVTDCLPGKPFIGSNGNYSGPFFRFVDSIITHIGLNTSNSALGGEIKRILTDMQKRGFSPFPGTPKRNSK